MAGFIFLGMNSFIRESPRQDLLARMRAQKASTIIKLGGKKLRRPFERDGFPASSRSAQKTFHARLQQSISISNQITSRSMRGRCSVLRLIIAISAFPSARCSWEGQRMHRWRICSSKTATDLLSKDSPKLKSSVMDGESQVEQASKSRQ